MRGEIGNKYNKLENETVFVTELWCTNQSHIDGSISVFRSVKFYGNFFKSENFGLCHFCVIYKHLLSSVPEIFNKQKILPFFVLHNLFLITQLIYVKMFFFHFLSFHLCLCYRCLFLNNKNMKDTSIETYLSKTAGIQTTCICNKNDLL